MRQCSSPHARGTLSGELRYLTDLLVALRKAKQLLPSRSETLGTGTAAKGFVGCSHKSHLCLRVSQYLDMARKNVPSPCIVHVHIEVHVSTQQRLAACALQELRACRCLGSCTHISALLRDMDMLLDLGLAASGVGGFSHLARLLP